MTDGCEARFMLSKKIKFSVVIFTQRFKSEIDMLLVLPNDNCT